MAREGTTPPFATDRELVLAFQQGKSAAYDEIYRLYAPRIRRVCTRMLKNSQDVDEATQETFLKAYQALGRFNGQYQLGAWLSRIASNVCLDHIRARSRNAVQVTLSDEHEAAGTERGPEDIVVGEDPRIQEVISGIQPLHAEALKLRALKGLSHREMAGELHMTPAQVKALLHRARSSFRRAWDKAEGWALAPVAAIRGFFSDKPGSQASSNVLSFTPSLSPLLAERMATSAVIVAVALTGAPTSPGGESPERRAPAFAAPVTEDDVKSPAGAGRHRVAQGDQEIAVAPVQERTRPEASEPDPVTKVLEAVGEQKLPKEDQDDYGDDDDDDEGLGTPGPATAKPVVRKVRKVVQDVVD
ncbi:MAG TPA: sigma-70 family RNA polymerase sigma factor [Actinomycetota bacterium]|nr:sigma-70 family RNA polymerase sigma factor [Actinomycetota bacterium]